MPTFSKAAARFVSCEPVRFKFWIKHFGDRDLESIRRRDVIEAIEGLKCGPASKNRYLAYLSAFFRHCIELETLTVNPCVGIRRKREPEGRQGWLNEAQLDQLILESRKSRNKDLWRWVAIAASTGMRKSEVERLRREDIEDDAVVVRVSKNGSSRRIPRSTMFNEAVEGLPSSGRLLKGFPRQAYVLAVARCGFPVPIVFHSLRHSFATRMAHAGLDVATSQKLMGWKTPSMALRYQHHSFQLAQNAVNSVFK